MAGHSHWAGIKHKKGKADKQKSKIFSKLSKEITVAAKLGDKDPNMNARLRSAIQSARSAIRPRSGRHVLCRTAPRASGPTRLGRTLSSTGLPRALCSTCSASFPQ